MNDSTNQTQKEREIEMAWSQHNRTNESPTPDKDEVFKMREKGQI